MKLPADFGGPKNESWTSTVFLEFFFFFSLWTGNVRMWRERDTETNMFLLGPVKAVGKPSGEPSPAPSRNCFRFPLAPPFFAPAPIPPPRGVLTTFLLISFEFFVCFSSVNDVRLQLEEIPSTAYLKVSMVCVVSRVGRKGDWLRGWQNWDEMNCIGWLTVREWSADDRWFIYKFGVKGRG